MEEEQLHRISSHNNITTVIKCSITTVIPEHETQALQTEHAMLHVYVI